MARYSSVMCFEIAAIWREHLKAWRDSDLNQRLEDALEHMVGVHPKADV